MGNLALNADVPGILLNRLIAASAGGLAVALFGELETLLRPFPISPDFHHVHHSVAPRQADWPEIVLTVVPRTSAFIAVERSEK